MTEEVLFTQEGQLGFITLNRPGALNSLTLTMILSMQRQLSRWLNDDSIHAVIVQAVPGNAFCAGGDIRSLYNSGRLNDSEQMQFFWHEYRLNHFIHHLGKPYISLIDGIVMGGALEFHYMAVILLQVIILFLLCRRLVLVSFLISVPAIY